MSEPGREATEATDTTLRGMRDEVDMERLTSQLMTAVEETMQPTHISLWLRSASGDSQQELR